MAALPFQPAQPVGQGPDFMDEFQKGWQMAIQQKQVQAQQEGRELEKEMLKLRMTEMKTEEKRNALQQKMQQRQALEAEALRLNQPRQLGAVTDDSGVEQMPATEVNPEQIRQAQIQQAAALAQAQQAPRRTIPLSPEVGALLQRAGVPVPQGAQAIPEEMFELTKSVLLERERAGNKPDRFKAVGDYVFDETTRSFIPSPKVTSGGTGANADPRMVAQAEELAAGVPKSGGGIPIKEAGPAAEYARKVLKVGVYANPKVAEQGRDLIDLGNKAVELRRLLADPKIQKGWSVGGKGWIRGTESWLGYGITNKPGQKVPRKFHDVTRLMRDLSDQVLRDRSGAAINADEYKRIVEFALNPNAAVDKNIANLEAMIKYLTNSVNQKIGGKDLALPGTDLDFRSNYADFLTEAPQEEQAAPKPAKPSGGAATPQPTPRPTAAPKTGKSRFIIEEVNE